MLEECVVRINIDTSADSKIKNKHGGSGVLLDPNATDDDVEGGTPFVEMAIEIDVGTCECRVAVWRDSKVELLQNRGGQRMMPSYVLFRGNTPSIGVSSDVPYHQPLELFSESATFNVKRLIGRMDMDLVVHNSKNFPFMIETLAIDVRTFITTLSSGARYGEREREHGFQSG
ncbi:hypothetical protein SUGI_0821490 [Cryptomeria japonica]|nr:hypothetical protein SUGI_0821490 [Cryptomeria japonica]